jgi:hypothetical protein
MNPTIETLFDRYRAGLQTLLVTGRAPLDLDPDDDGNVRPLEFLLAQHAAREFKMGTLIHNIALGPRWELGHFLDKKQADDFRNALHQAGIQYTDNENGYERPPHERVYNLLRQVYQAIKRDRVPPHLLLFEFLEDILGDEPGLPRDVVLQVAELIAVLSHDYSLRRHQILLLFFSEFPESLPDRIVRNLPTVHLPNPDRAAKKVFIQALKRSALRQNATYGPALDDETAANLTANTPNSGLERLFLESDKSGKPIRESQLLAQKWQDILRLSQGTLSLLDTTRIRDICLRGRMVSKPLSLLRSWGARLKAGSPKVPRNILLCGAPSTAKTDLALIFGDTAGVNTLQLLSPKGSLVGQTERLCRLQSRCLLELAPALGFVDELTEAFPTSRSESNLDAGASAAVIAELLTTLSDKSRAGRSIFLATTNIPFKIGAALLSRFVVLPVLSATLEDFPGILTAIARTIEFSLAAELEGDATIREAAQVFFEKGCSPRLMRESLVITSAMSEAILSPDLILESAKMAAETTQRDRASAEFADLFAIKLASDRRFLPWADNSRAFPYPHYLRGLIHDDGGVDQDKLDVRLQELRPLVDL